MDITAIQTEIDALNAQIVTDEATLSDDQAKLAELQAELAQATLINGLEALTADEVTAINAALAADGSQISVSLPPATEPQV